MRLFQTKLILLFNSLEAGEVRDFKRFVESVWYQPKKDAVRMFYFLRQHHPCQEGDFEEEDLFKASCPDARFSESRLKTVMAHLKKVLDQFLVTRVLEEDSVYGQIALLDEYTKRGLHKHFQYLKKRVSDQLAKTTVRNHQFFQNSYLFQRATYASTDPRSAQHHDSLQSLNDGLDHYYFAAKLRYFCDMLTAADLYQEDFDLSLAEPILRQVRQKELVRFPVIGMYYHYYHLLSGEDQEPHYQAFKSLLSEFSSHFEQDEVRGFYLRAINYAIRRMNSGEEDFASEVFGLFREALESGYLFDGQYLSFWSFSNIVSTGLKLEENGWVKGFLQEYENRIPEEGRVDIAAYNRAKYYLAEGDFRAVLRELAPVKIRDIFIDLDIRSLKTMAYFELQEISLMENELNNLRVHLYRKDFQTYHRTNYDHFISFLRKLVALPPGDEQAKSSLENAIHAEPQVKNKAWLLSKISSF